MALLTKVSKLVVARWGLLKMSVNWRLAGGVLLTKVSNYWRLAVVGLLMIFSE